MELLDNGLFDDDGNNAFGLVIFPDHVAGSEDKILKLFKQTGIDMFKKFDGFKIFISTVFISHPLAILLTVIKVEH